MSASDAWKIIACLAKQGGRFRLRKRKALGAASLSHRRRMVAEVGGFSAPVRSAAGIAQQLWR